MATTKLAKRQGKGMGKNHPIRIRARVNAERAVSLRADGLTYREIAEIVGYHDAQHAAHSIDNALTRTLTLATDKLRSLEARRLDRLTAKLTAKLEADAPDPDKARYIADPEAYDKAQARYEAHALQVIDRVLKVSGQRAKLLGLDKPVVSLVEHSGTAQPTETLSLSQANADKLAELEARWGAPPIDVTAKVRDHDTEHKSP